jgi:hypothetical protein
MVYKAKGHYENEIAANMDIGDSINLEAQFLSE